MQRNRGEKIEWESLETSSRKLEIPKEQVTFHAKMGTIKDRNSMDLTEAEDFENRWQEYTEDLYKKDLNDPDNHDGVIIHLEPDILECKVKHYLLGFEMAQPEFHHLLALSIVMLPKVCLTLHFRITLGE